MIASSALADDDERSMDVVDVDQPCIASGDRIDSPPAACTRSATRSSVSSAPSHRSPPVVSHGARCASRLLDSVVDEHESRMNKRKSSSAAHNCEGKKPARGCAMRLEALAIAGSDEDASRDGRDDDGESAMPLAMLRPSRSADGEYGDEEEDGEGGGKGGEGSATAAAAAAAEWIGMFHSMSHAAQRTALSQLVSVAARPHIMMLRALIEPHFQTDFLRLLPPEMGLHVVSLLSPDDIVRVAGVSRRWLRLCEDDHLWRLKCRREGITHIDEPSVRHSNAWLTPAGSAPGIHIYDHMDETEQGRQYVHRERRYGSVFARSEWKSAYLRRERILANWRSRKIAGSCVLRGHDEHVITCMQMRGDRIVTGSDDNTLKVWSVEKGQCLFTLAGHSGGVWTSQMSEDGKYIVSGSTDRTVRVWSAIDGQQLFVLTGHTSTVRCMSLAGNVLVSGSRDTTLRLWDIETGYCLKVLNGHLAAVRCVQFDGKRVVSGAYDFVVRVWNAETGECEHVLTGHTNRVYSLLFDPEKHIVVSGSLDTTIRVWDVSRGVPLWTLTGHHSLTSGMQLRGDILVSCNADSTVRVWNLRDGTCQHRLHGSQGHSSAITSLQFLDHALVATSSDDGSVKLWDVQQGTFVRDIIKLGSGGSGGCIWRLKATDNVLACAVGSRNGTEDTKLILIDFDAAYP